MAETPQDRGRALEYVIAKKFGGERVAGSGNMIGRKLDARGQDIVVSSKYTDAQSMRVSDGMIDEVARAVMGPEAAHLNVAGVLVVQIGPEGKPMAMLDLELLIDWLKTPPEIVPATKQDVVRAQAKTPSLLR